MNTTSETNDAIQVDRASPHPIMTSSVKTNVKVCALLFFSVAINTFL